MSNNTYVPKVNDTVYLKPQGFVRYVITEVDAQKHTADLKNTSGVIVLTHDIPWELIVSLDAGQNALRIVREATEEE